MKNRMKPILITMIVIILALLDVFIAGKYLMDKKVNEISIKYFGE